MSHAYLLSSLLEQLSPRTISDKVDRPIWEARESFRGRVRVRSYDELVDELTNFVIHMNNCYGITDLPAPAALGDAEDYLRRKGSDLEQAYYNSVTGQHQGLGASLDIITEGFAKSMANKWVTWVFSTEVGSESDYNLILGLMSALRDKYQAFFPWETVDSAGMMFRWKEIVIQLASTFNSLHRNLGKY